MREALLARTEMVAKYARWFVNRTAYTRQSDRPHPESGRNYYYRPRAEGGGEVSLELEDVRRHLAGEMTLGIHAINPETQRVKWMGIEGDDKRSLDDLLKLQYERQQDGIQAGLDGGRRGGHCGLFETRVLAKDARVYMRHLAGKLSVHAKASGPSDGIEMFPKQDRIEPEQFRNAIRGPLGIHRVLNRRYWFYGTRHDLEAQMKYLRELRRVTESQLSGLIDGLALEERGPPEQSTGSRSDRYYFQILDCLNPEGLRRVGRNWATQCPICATAGRDRGKYNLAISVEEP